MGTGRRKRGQASAWALEEIPGLYPELSTAGTKRGVTFAQFIKGCVDVRSGVKLPIGLAAGDEEPRAGVARRPLS